jgi:hypothetical protein
MTISDRDLREMTPYEHETLRLLTNIFIGVCTTAALVLATVVAIVFLALTRF